MKDSMKIIKNTVIWYTLSTIYFMVCFLIMLNSYSYAYVDATSVTYIVQAIVGIFVAIGAVATVQRHKIIAAYRKWHYGRVAKKQRDIGMKNKESIEKQEE